MMEKNLHSFETYLYKYFLPVAVVPWDRFHSIRASFSPTDPHAKTMLVLFLSFWVVVTPFVFWYAIKIKRVVCSENFLRVKGYLREIDIRLADVESVTEGGVARMKHLTLRLKVPSEFGERIWFIPKKKSGIFRSGKSTLEEMQELINSARGI